MCVWLPELFELGGPFHDGRLIGDGGRLDLSRISGSVWTKARTFAVKHLSQCIAPPTVAIAAGNAVYGYWRLKQALHVNEDTTAILASLQQRLARFLHAPRILPSAGVLPMPVVRTKNGTKHRSARLLWVRPKLIYDRKGLDRRLEPFASSLVGPEDLGGSRWPKPSVLMEVRTLPVGWGIEQLDLPPAALGLLSGASDVVIMKAQVAEVARAMAAKGYGFLDVEAVVNDVRFALGLSGVGLGYSTQALQKIYRDALRFVSDRDPPRLPYGIKRLVPLLAADGSARRFLVEGGTRQLPFSIEVTAETRPPRLAVCGDAFGALRDPGGTPNPGTMRATGMQSVHVDKTQLVEAVKSGLQQHKEELLLAREEWRTKTRERCANLTEAVGAFDATTGSFEGDPAGLQDDRSVRIDQPPEDMTRRYERVLRMLDLETRDEIRLSAEEFCQYIDNDWAWRSRWFEVNQAYTSERRAGR